MKSELKEAIKNSGNNLHSEIVEFLEKLEWQVELSVYYCDDITDKPREIDIIAIKKFSIYDGKCPEKYKFSVCLIIECKNFKNEIVFRVQQNNIQDNTEAIIFQEHNMGMQEILNKSSLKQNHHYLSTDKIAKLYDASDKKTEGLIFEAITQPIKSLIFLKTRTQEKTIFYPFVVYKGIQGFYTIDKPDYRDEYLDSLEPTKNVIFSLKYSYKILNPSPMTLFSSNYFCIDFVYQEKFGEYVNMIEKFEIEEIKKYLRKKYNKEDRGD